MIILAILLQTSTCTTYGNTTNCTQQQPLRPAPIITQQYPPEMDGAAAGNLGLALRARKERGRRKTVGKLLAAGKCQEAESYALGKGELELAAYARSYCAAR